MRKSSRFLIIALAAALFYSAQAGAGLVGDEVIIRGIVADTFDDPSPTATFIDETVTVLETLEEYSDIRFSFQIEDDSITFTDTSTAGFPDISTFNGFVFDDLDWRDTAGEVIPGSALVDFTWETDFIGVTEDNFYFDGNTIAFNYDDVTAGSYVTIDLVTNHDAGAVVPVPAAAPLALLGLGIVGLVKRRKSRS